MATHEYQALHETRALIRAETAPPTVPVTSSVLSTGAAFAWQVRSTFGKGWGGEVLFFFALIFIFAAATGLVKTTRDAPWSLGQGSGSSFRISHFWLLWNNVPTLVYKINFYTSFIHYLPNGFQWQFTRTSKSPFCENTERSTVEFLTWRNFCNNFQFRNADTVILSTREVINFSHQKITVLRMLEGINAKLNWP